MTDEEAVSRFDRWSVSDMGISQQLRIRQLRTQRPSRDRQTSGYDIR